MNKLTIAVTIGAILLAGCTSTAEKNAYYAAVESKNQAIVAAAKAKSDATMARMKVFEEAAKSSSGDTVKVAAMMAAAFTESGVNGTGQQGQQAPASVEQAPGMNTAAWINAFLGIGNIAVQAYSINANKAISIGAQNAQVATAQSTNNMVTAITTAGFGSNTNIANSGFTAMTTLGTTLGQPNVTLTGNGNAYASGGTATANYTQTTTTRTCSTGNAGNGAAGAAGGNGGGTTGSGGAGAPGGAGGVGGAATC